MEYSNSSGTRKLVHLFTKSEKLHLVEHSVFWKILPRFKSLIECLKVFLKSFWSALAFYVTFCLIFQSVSSTWWDEHFRYYNSPVHKSVSNYLAAPLSKLRWHLLQHLFQQWTCPSILSKACSSLWYLSHFIASEMLIKFFVRHLFYPKLEEWTKRFIGFPGI